MWLVLKRMDFPPIILYKTHERLISAQLCFIYQKAFHVKQENGLCLPNLLLYFSYYLINICFN